MTNYEYGFITKCAEYGVDPVELIKIAAPGGIFNVANWQVSDNAHNFENDIEARAAQHAKDVGMNRYDANNKAGTRLSRWWNRNTKSEEEYQDWYANQKSKEMEKDISRTNKINQFGSNLTKVSPVYSAKPNGGAPQPAQTNTPNPGNSQRANPAISTIRATPIASQQAPAQPAQQALARPTPNTHPQPPQVPNKYPPIVRGRQGGTDWTGV